MRTRPTKRYMIVAVLPAQLIASFPAAAQLTAIELSYPPAALIAGHQGAVGYEVALSKQGKVKTCRVTQSSGYADLDEQTCVQLRKTGRFKIALDPAGKPTESSYAGRLRWLIPRSAPTPVRSANAQ